MVSLREALFKFFHINEQRLSEQEANNVITLINALQSQPALDIAVKMVPVAVLTRPVVHAAIEAKKAELAGEDQNTIWKGAVENIFKEYQDLLSPLAEGAGVLFTSALKGGYGGVRDAFGEGTGFIIDAMFDSLESRGQPIPRQLREDIKGTLGSIAAAKMTTEIAGVLAELMHPAKNMGMSGMSHILHDVAGFTAMSDAVTRPLHRALIGFPLEQSINAAIQPYDPPSRIVQAFVQRRILTPEDYRDVLRSEGWQPRYVDAATEALYRVPSLLNLQRMFDTGRPDPAWVEGAVKRMGFSDDDVPRIIESLNYRAVQRETGDIRSLQRSQFKRGVITREEYTAILQGRGFTVGEVQAFIDAIEAERRYEDREDLLKLYERKFINNRMDADDLTVVMSEAGKNPDYIATRIEILNEQRLAKLSADDRDLLLTRGDYVSAYKMGLISRDSAVQSLDDMGYTTEDAVFIIDLVDAQLAASADKPGEPGSKSVSRSDIVAGFKKKLLDYDMALQALIALGYEEEDADFILAVAATTATEGDKSPPEP